MNKKTLLIGLAVLLLGSGAVAIIATSGGGNDNNNNNQEANPANNQTEQSNGNPFEAVSTEGLDFVADLTITSEGKTTTGKLEQDGKTARYSITAEGKTSSFVYAGKTVYSCTGSKCFKFTSGQQNSGVDVGSYQYTADELGAYKTSSTHQGTQSCSTGTCDVYSVTNSGVTSTIFIDQGSKRLVQVEGNIGGQTTKIVYTYKDVTIEVPTNAQSLPNYPQ